MIRYEDIPRDFNLTTFFLDRNVEEGRGDRVALTGDATVTYAELAALANRAGNVLLEPGVRPEDRVLLALRRRRVPRRLVRRAEDRRWSQRSTPSCRSRTTRTSSAIPARVVVVDEVTAAPLREASRGGALAFDPRRRRRDGAW